MRFVQMESTTFLVREKSFDPKAFRIQAACLFGSVHIADQIQRLLIAFSPATEEQNGTISFSGHGCLRECDEGARLDIPAHGIEAKSRTVPRRCHVTPRTAHVGPPRRLQRVLQVCAIKFAITKQHHRRTERDQLLYLLDQCDMEVFGKVSLLPLAYQPRQRQGSTFIDHMHHQRHTPTPYQAAVDHQHQPLQGEMSQQDFGIGEKIDLLRDRVIVHPPGKAFAPALRLSAVGHFHRDVRQLRALAGDDATDEGSPGSQVPGALPLRLTRIPLCQGSPYGTILAEVVTHRMLLLCWGVLTLQYTMWQPLKRLSQNNLEKLSGSETHDYILIYARDFDSATIGRFARTTEQREKFKNPDDDPRGLWKAENLSAGKYYSAGQFE